MIWTTSETVAFKPTYLDQNPSYWHGLKVKISNGIETPTVTVPKATTKTRTNGTTHMFTKAKTSIIKISMGSSIIKIRMGSSITLHPPHPLLRVAAIATTISIVTNKPADEDAAAVAAAAEATDVVEVEVTVVEVVEVTVAEVRSRDEDDQNSFFIYCINV